MKELSKAQYVFGKSVSMYRKGWKEKMAETFIVSKINPIVQCNRGLPVSFIYWKIFFCGSFLDWLSHCDIWLVWLLVFFLLVPFLFVGKFFWLGVLVSWLFFVWSTNFVGMFFLVGKFFVRWSLLLVG